MGEIFTLPVKTKPMSFADGEQYTATGKLKQEFVDSQGPSNTFEEITEHLFEDITRQRIACVIAKEKFRNIDMDAINERFPQWSLPEILDLKAQFQTFDLNQDALIDFQELCDVLDELGDESREDERWRYFHMLDEDNSGAVDFEEFLALIDAVLSGLSELNTVGLTVQSGSQNAQKMRRLSVIQQLDVGLF